MTHKWCVWNDFIFLSLKDSFFVLFVSRFWNPSEPKKKLNEIRLKRARTPPTPDTTCASVNRDQLGYPPRQYKKSMYCVYCFSKLYLYFFPSKILCGWESVFLSNLDQMCIPESRTQVLKMWPFFSSFPSSSPKQSTNFHFYFQLYTGGLKMSVL